MGTVLRYIVSIVGAVLCVAIAILFLMLADTKNDLQVAQAQLVTAQEHLKIQEQTIKALEKQYAVVTKNLNQLNKDFSEIETETQDRLLEFTIVPEDTTTEYSNKLNAALLDLGAASQ